MEYYQNVRTDMLSLIEDKKNLKVLEIGAAEGNTLLYLKEKGIASYVSGIELVSIPNSNQNSDKIDSFAIANIETDKVELEKDYDLIICGDVLEHLVNPWKTLRLLKDHLKSGGMIIYSLPNIRYIGALIKIFLLGSFKYEEHGIFDRTHLRFFCKKDAINLSSESGLQPRVVKSDLDLPAQLGASKFSKKKVLNMLTLGLFKNFLSYQTIVLSEKA
jgi:2-polyprenyl-3-methyl-5-hydroxy-6-metoxy-1,4-benzoquinol methylase